MRTKSVRGVGADVGTCVGGIVGADVGVELGRCVGARVVGSADGSEVGTNAVGGTVLVVGSGEIDGGIECPAVGADVGDRTGSDVGWGVGSAVGRSDGDCVGESVGNAVPLAIRSAHCLYSKLVGEDVTVGGIDGDGVVGAELGSALVVGDGEGSGEGSGVVGSAVGSGVGSAVVGSAVGRTHETALSAQHRTTALLELSVWHVDAPSPLPTRVMWEPVPQLVYVQVNSSL